MIFHNDDDDKHTEQKTICKSFLVWLFCVLKFYAASCRVVSSFFPHICVFENL